MNEHQQYVVLAGPPPKSALYRYGGASVLLCILGAIVYWQMAKRPAESAASVAPAVSQAQQASAPRLNATQVRLECRLSQQGEAIALRTLIDRDTAVRELTSDELAASSLALLKARNLEIPFSAAALENLRLIVGWTKIPNAGAARANALRIAESQKAFDDCVEITKLGPADHPLVDWTKLDWQTLPPPEAVAVAAVAPSASDHGIPAWEASQRQRREDAVAAVKASWRPQIELMETILVAYKCDVVDQLSTSVALGRVQNVMADTAARSGVGGGRDGLDIKSATDAAASSASGLVKAGICAKLTPEWRGQVRSTVGSLMR